jgi:DHA2 family multidrug resistance protein
MPKNPFRQAAIRRVPSFHHEHVRYRWWVLANVMLSTFMAVLNSTVVNGALPSMMNALGVSLDSAQWVLTTYLLIFSVMLPLSAWLSERFGSKLIFFLAMALFTGGSFLCFVSWDFTTLIVSRVLQGAGGGILMPLGMTLITREFPPHQRGMAMGFWTIASAAASSFGPSIGGYLIDTFGWRSTFLINVPIGLLALFATLVIQREIIHPEKKPFDFSGFLTVTVFLVALLLALTDGNASWNTDGWSAPFIIFLLSLSALALLTFLVIELTTPFPLVELRLLKLPTFSMANGVMFFLYLCLMGSTFLLPLYFQNVLGYSALLSGLMFLPMGLMMALFSPLSGLMVNWIGPKIPAIFGLCVLGASMFLSTLFDSDPAPWLISVPLILRGVAFGLILTPLQVMALSSLSSRQMAQGSSLLNLIRQVGGSFGVAIFGMILAQRNIFHRAVAGEGLDPNGEVFNNAVGHLKLALIGNSGVPPVDAHQVAAALIVETVAKNAYIQAICDVFFIVAVLSLASVIPVLLVRSPSSKKAVRTKRPVCEKEGRAPLGLVKSSTTRDIEKIFQEK